MNIFNAISLLLSLCAQAYIAMMWIGLKSMEIHALLMHASSGGKDTSSILSWVTECCKSRLDWNRALLLFLGAQRDGEEDSPCLRKWSVCTHQPANGSLGKKRFAPSRSDWSQHLVRDEAPSTRAPGSCPLPAVPWACISWLLQSCCSQGRRTSKGDGRQKGGKIAFFFLFPELKKKINVFCVYHLFQSL